MSGLSETVNRSENIFRCADRVSPGDDPRDITQIKELYLPLDVSHSAVHIRKNPFGSVIYRNKVSAGNIYHSYDGKRLVLEAGCNTVIYILINQKLAAQHHRLFIQSDAGFSADTTIRRDATEIARNTRHVETIVKYEMFFIMGAISTLSLSAWLAVTGTDVTVLYSRKKVVSDAAKLLSQSVLKDLDEIQTYAPTMHTIIWKLIALEANVLGKKSAGKAPLTALKSEKVQAQVAGVIFGKAAMPSSGTFSGWSLIATLLSQAAIKSSLAYPDAFMKVLNSRYIGLADRLKSADPRDPSSLVQAAQAMVELMRENGLTVSTQEMTEVIKEIKENPQRAYKNLSSIVAAVARFRRVVNQ